MSTSIYIILLFNMIQYALSLQMSSNITTSMNDISQNLFSGKSGIQLGPGIVAILAIVGGFIISLFGYKLFRPVLFACGFAVGSIIGYTFIIKVFKDSSWVAIGAWIAFIVFGLILGFLVISFYNCGIFLIGAAAGILLAFFLNTSFLYKISPSHPDTVLYIAIVVLAIIGGLIATWIEKPAIIVATSFFGAVASIWGIGYFAGSYPCGAELKEFQRILDNGDYTIDIPSAWWGYFVATIILFLIGLYWQFNKSSKGSNHHNHKESRAVPRTQYQEASTPTGAKGNPISMV